MVLSASFTIFNENNNRKSIKNIKPIYQKTALQDWSTLGKLRRRRDYNCLLNLIFSPCFAAECVLEMQGDFEEAGTIVLVMVDTYMEEEHIGEILLFFI